VKETESVVPGRLRSKIPPLFTMLFEQRIFWTLFGLGLCYLGLYMDVRTVGVRNGYLCFLGPFLVPGAVVLRYKFFPLNPYRTVAGKVSPARKATQEDPDGKRLVELLRSSTAWHFATKRSALLSGILMFTSILVVFLWPARIVWTTSPPQLLIVGFTIAFAGAVGLVNTELVSWALKTWALDEQAGN
jgi:hypothetical protein